MSAFRPLHAPHRLTRLLLPVLLLGAAVVVTGGVLPAGTASAAAPTVEQCNGVDNQGGQELRCEVTITNALDLATGEGSSTVTVQECHGPAAAPTCGTSTTTSFDDVTTAVAQCNGSGSGGGGVVTCEVRITNTITGDATTAAATVNQCNGSGTGGGTEPTVQCSPLGSTTDATVTQCNSSGNGGGATLRVRCQVDPSTQTAALLVSIDQCNGSGNGGGATVTCRSAVTNTVEPAVVVPSPSASASPSPSTSPGPSASASPSPSASSSPSATPVPSSATPSTPVPDVTVPPAGGVDGGGGVPAAAPSPPADSSRSFGGPGLPRTGTDAGALALVGLLLTALGGAFVLSGHTPRLVGRHARPSLWSYSW